jgi:hypothetical protein
MSGVSMVKVEEELRGFEAASTCVVNTAFDRGGIQAVRNSNNATEAGRLYFKRMTQYLKQLRKIQIPKSKQSIKILNPKYQTLSSKQTPNTKSQFEF